MRHPRVRIRRLLLPLLLAVPLPSAAGATDHVADDSGEDGPIWVLQIENDFFTQLTNTDRHYTNGLRISRISAPGGVPRWLGALARVPSNFGPDMGDPEQRWGFSIGHSMFTPDDTDAVALVPDDRPYAAWAYLGFSVHSVYRGVNGSGRQDVFAIEAGIVGPSAKGEEIQNAYHKLINVALSNGWDNQLSDEPGLQLIFERKWRSTREELDEQGRFETDMIPHVAVSLGNIMTDVGLGGMLRYGQNLQNDFGPPRIRPGVPGSEGFERVETVDWYVFAGLEGRYVLRNIFLDGNTWKDSHSVEKRPFVIDMQVGGAILIGSTRLTYTHVIMSPEFNEQREWDHFGALTLSWRL